MIQVPKIEDKRIADRHERQEYEGRRLSQFEADDKSQNVSNCSGYNQNQRINADRLNNKMSHFWLNFQM